MAQSLSKVPVHIVFSTKNREAVLDDAIQPEIHSVLGAICNDFECTPISVGGVEDHVHILCILSKKIAIMKLVEQLKVRTSIWIKHKHQQYRHFHWQAGYAVFAVDCNHTTEIAEYIARQKEHHAQKSFEDEQRELMLSANMQWDERYIWD